MRGPSPFQLKGVRPLEGSKESPNMTLRQTIQAAPAKTTELISKLASTSNNAVKTRESLFAELTSELSLYVDVEEQHLVPLLRKHAGTKALAADAARANKDLRAQLTALEAMPKDTDDFLGKVTELKKSFQQHVRDERHELLPAVLKALSDEEANDTADKMQTAVADVEEAKRAEKRAENAEAKRMAAEDHEAEELDRAAVSAAKSAQRATRDAAEKTAETLQQTAAKFHEGARQMTKKLTETTTNAVSSARDAATIYRASSENLVQDLGAISASSRAVAKATSDVGSAMTEWVRNTAAVNVNASRKMLQCRNFADVAKAQQEYLETSMRTWMEGRSAFLQIAQRVSKQALNPLQARIEKAA